MPTWTEVVNRRQRRLDKKATGWACSILGCVGVRWPEWQFAKVQCADIPEQGRLPRVWKDQGRDPGHLQRQVAPGCCEAQDWTPWDTNYHGQCEISGPDQRHSRCTHAGKEGGRTSKSCSHARGVHQYLGGQGAARRGSMRRSQLPGQNMDPVRARIRKAVVSGEKTMETLQKAQAAFEHAHQDVVQAQQDSEGLMQEAPIPIVQAPHTSSNFVKSVEVLTTPMRWLHQRALFQQSRIRKCFSRPHRRWRTRRVQPIGLGGRRREDGGLRGRARSVRGTEARPSDHTNEVQHPSEHRDSTSQEIVDSGTRLRRGGKHDGEPRTSSFSRVPCRTPGTSNSQS